MCLHQEYNIDSVEQKDFVLFPKNYANLKYSPNMLDFIKLSIHRTGTDNLFISCQVAYGNTKPNENIYGCSIRSIQQLTYQILNNHSIKNKIINYYRKWKFKKQIYNMLKETCCPVVFNHGVLNINDFTHQCSVITGIYNKTSVIFV